MAGMSQVPGAFRWIPALFMMGTIFGLSSLPASLIPYYGPLDFLLKKGGHAMGYAFLALTYYFALPPRLSSLYRAALSLLMAVLFALSDEFHQSFVEGRTSSLRDVVIDSAGAGLALTIVTIYSSNSSSTSAA